MLTQALLMLPPLLCNSRDPLFVPCTPKGCLELLKRSGVQVGALGCM